MHKVAAVAIACVLCVIYMLWARSDAVVRLDGQTFVEYDLSHYMHLVRQFRGFQQMPDEQKCRVYFQELYRVNPDWSVGTFDDALSNADAINEQLRHIRVYGKCYGSKGKSWIDTKGKKVEKAVGQRHVYLFENLRHLKNKIVSVVSPKPEELNCPDLQRKVLPYFTGRIPMYVRWDGERFSDPNQLVNTDQEYQKFDSSHFAHRAGDSKFTLCMATYMLDASKGKGIVITTDTAMAHQVVALIKVLRVLGNELPIQIVYTSITARRIKQILEVSRKSKQDLQIPQHLFDDLSDDTKRRFDKFPKQKVWLVNIKDCLDVSKYPDVYKGYANKLNAVMFSTFEDIILMDADAVPYVPMELFFNLSHYKNTQTMFFQDRTDTKLNPEQFVDFFKRLMPSELDRKLFGFSPASQKTLGNRYLGSRYYYYMEAGLVAINKRTHYTGFLTAFQLNLWSKITTEMLWGDKELYWLGLAIAGDDNYSFNSKAAVSVGEISSNSQKLYPESTAREVCSTHPGQVSDSDHRTLLWINSGVKTCKNWKALSWDQSQPRYQGMKRADLRAYYASPIRIVAAIEPPQTPPVEIPEFFDQSELTQPISGWKQTQFCDSYLWCAYDTVNWSRGLVVEYGPQEVAWFEYIGHCGNEAGV